MNRFAASILAIGLIAAIGTVSAQDQRYPAPVDDRYPVQTQGTYSDYARVTRVDPVLQSGYGSTQTSSGRCYSDDDVYADSRYDGRDDNRYNSRGYDDRSEDRRYEDRYANTQGTATGRNVSAVLAASSALRLAAKSAAARPATPPLPSARWSAAWLAAKSTRPRSAIVSLNPASPSATRYVKAATQMRATMSPPMT